MDINIGKWFSLFRFRLFGKLCLPNKLFYQPSVFLDLVFTFCTWERYIYIISWPKSEYLGEFVYTSIVSLHICLECDCIDTICLYYPVPGMNMWNFKYTTNADRIESWRVSCVSWQKNDILASKSIVIHGFSIGAFIYTQLQLAFEKDPTSFLDVCQRMTGVVMDSPAYMDHMCQGIADSASSVSIVRILINSSLRFYLRMFPKSVTFHYCEAERIFYSNTVPTLFLYSSADKISSTAVTERYIEAWRKKNLFVVGQKWHDSPHVGHLRKHPEEYSKALFFFLDRLNLGKIVQKTSS